MVGQTVGVARSDPVAAQPAHVRATQARVVCEAQSSSAGAHRAQRCSGGAHYCTGLNFHNAINVEILYSHVTCSVLVGTDWHAREDH